MEIKEKNSNIIINKQNDNDIDFEDMFFTVVATWEAVPEDVKVWDRVWIDFIQTPKRNVYIPWEQNSYEKRYIATHYENILAIYDK